MKALASTWFELNITSDKSLSRHSSPMFPADWFYQWYDKNHQTPLLTLLATAATTTQKNWKWKLDTDLSAGSEYAAFQLEFLKLFKMLSSIFERNCDRIDESETRTLLKKLCATIWLLYPFGCDNKLNQLTPLSKCLLFYRRHCAV